MSVIIELIKGGTYSDVGKKYVKGPLKIDGVLQPNKRVAVFYRGLLQLIVSGITNSNGEYFLFLPDSVSVSSELLIVGFDDNKVYNSAVLDFVTPSVVTVNGVY